MVALQWPFVSGPTRPLPPTWIFLRPGKEPDAYFCRRVQKVNMETQIQNPNESSTATEKTPTVKKRRARRNTFGTRITVSYRFPEDLHAAMVNYCADNTTPINTWLVGLVEEQMIAAGYMTPSKPKPRKPA